jgi:cell fate (sporulation/competence/biofilm development) regulator YmcA (YheA/YmcA/DUF963 family)
METYNKKDDDIVTVITPIPAVPATEKVEDVSISKKIERKVFLQGELAKQQSEVAALRKQALDINGRADRLEADSTFQKEIDAIDALIQKAADAGVQAAIDVLAVPDVPPGI